MNAGQPLPPAVERVFYSPEEIEAAIGNPVRRCIDILGLATMQLTRMGVVEPFHLCKLGAAVQALSELQLGFIDSQAMALIHTGPPPPRPVIAGDQRTGPPSRTEALIENAVGERLDAFDNNGRARAGDGATAPPLRDGLF